MMTGQLLHASVCLPLPWVLQERESCCGRGFLREGRDLWLCKGKGPQEGHGLVGQEATSPLEETGSYLPRWGRRRPTGSQDGASAE